MTQPMDNLISRGDRLYTFGMSAAKATRFALLFTSVLPKSGMFKGIDLAKIHQLAIVAHSGFLAGDATRQVISWQKSESHGPFERLSEISEMALFTSSASVMALAIHAKLRPFLNTDWKLQVERLMLGSFLIGSGTLVAHHAARAAGFVDTRKGCPHNDVACNAPQQRCVEKQASSARFAVLGSLFLFSYALAETTAWVKGPNFRPFGKIDLWKIRTATGVLSGLGGMAAAIRG